MSVIDLHCHTTASDGSLSPRGLVMNAKDRGVDIIAVTDHDTVDGIDEAISAGAELGVRVVAGIELSSRHEGRNVHVLGYFVDTRADVLRTELVAIVEARVVRARRIVERLNELGYELAMDEVLAQARGQIVARPHIARAMVARGYVATVKEAFGPELLADGGRADVPKQTLTAFQAIGVIRAAGGVSVLAHPGVGHHEGDAKSVRRDLVEALCATGLVGLEVDHPDHPPLMREELRTMADEIGLVPTGGSDFHGDPGHIIGTCTTAPQSLAALEATAGG